MRCDARSFKVRLAEIDAPEVAHPRRHKPGQPGGNAARAALMRLIGGQPIVVRASGEDRYGRVIGTLYRGAKNLNLAMVRLGEAWAYVRYVRNLDYVTAERAAQAARCGLWGLPANVRVPPWRWRHTH